MVTPEQWYKAFFPDKLGIEEKEIFLERTNRIQVDARVDLLDEIDNLKNELRIVEELASYPDH